MAEHDVYSSFAELARHEREGRDYRIALQFVEGCDVSVLAPHGGNIEPMTSEIARAIAASDFSFYAFEGIKPAGNRRLHITSVNLDEPQALALVAASRCVVTVHGLEGVALEVQVGGRDEALRGRVDAELRYAGFASRVEIAGPYGGMEARNICNRGETGAGVQIEIRAGLRDAIRNNPGRFVDFVDAVRRALAER